jgi:hypothetical protein
VKQVKDVRVFPFPGDGEDALPGFESTPQTEGAAIGRDAFISTRCRVLGVVELRAILEGLRVMCIE